MNVSPLTSASLAAVSQPNQPAPIRRDKDGDYDNNAREVKSAEPAPRNLVPGRLNVTA